MLEPDTQTYMSHKMYLVAVLALKVDVAEDRALDRGVVDLETDN